MAKRFDVTYYWHKGQWNPCDYTPEQVAKVNRMGYVAVNGLRSIGPPEGEPSPEMRRKAFTR